MKLNNQNLLNIFIIILAIVMGVLTLVLSSDYKKRLFKIDQIADEHYFIYEFDNKKVNYILEKINETNYLTIDSDSGTAILELFNYNDENLSLIFKSWQKGSGGVIMPPDSCNNFIVELRYIESFDFDNINQVIVHNKEEEAETKFLLKDFYCQ